MHHFWTSPLRISLKYSNISLKNPATLGKLAHINFYFHSPYFYTSNRSNHTRQFHTYRHCISKSAFFPRYIACARMSSDTESASTGAGSDDEYDSQYEEDAGNGLTLEGPPYGLEKVFDYEAGGHYPVHLSDVLHQRYRVIHKLGSGGFANVWLCRDTSANAQQSNKYVAVKIIMAEGSTDECPELRVSKLAELGPDTTTSTELWCLPLDRFDIKGPNGKHFVFVYPVLGPRVSRLLPIADYPNGQGEALRKISKQTTEAMALLHFIGICHGDFRPANILVRISGLSDLSEEEVTEIVGRPKTTKVVNAETEQPHDLSTAPQYLVFPINWDDVVVSGPKGAALLDNLKACVIDFGESYEISEPTPYLAIPQVYCSPEYCLEGAVGIGSDIWALGCTLFEIRTGRKLFDTLDDDRDEYLAKMAMVLGRFPEPWWAETWGARKSYFKDKNQDGTDSAGGRVVDVTRKGETGVDHTQSGSGVMIHSQKSEPRSLEDTVREGLFYEHRDRPGGLEQPISEREVTLLADLLGKLLRYSPAERLSPAAALEHEWFKFTESES